MDKSDLKNIIRKNAFKKGEKLYLICSDAFKIANEYKIEVAEIGIICNEQNIKICSCQLGCF